MAPEVRHIHAMLRDLDLYPTSAWCEQNHTDGPKSLQSLSSETIAGLIATNDRDLASSDAVLVVIPLPGTFMNPRPGDDDDAPRLVTPKETYCEARYATLLKIPVYWVGPPCLTSFREHVQRFTDIGQAIAAIRSKALFRERGAFVEGTT